MYLKQKVVVQWSLTSLIINMHCKQCTISSPGSPIEMLVLMYFNLLPSARANKDEWICEVECCYLHFMCTWMNYFDKSHVRILNKCIVRSEDPLAPSNALKFRRSVSHINVGRLADNNRQYASFCTLWDFLTNICLIFLLNSSKVILQ